MVIAVGMAIFLVFSSLLSWVRQYLVLHTGNRVDAVLGSAVFEHLLKLPPRYFEQRPTGVITARLRGVENIREFIASAAVTLMLDLPFLFIFVAVMFDYSVLLTLIALGLIGLIVLMSLFVAPIFRERLNEQFLIGARNQAFTTEYIAGMETVKSLQMEPLLVTGTATTLRRYLGSGFAVRQIANTYNVLAGGIDQLTTLLILAVGAYLVMNGTDFTIGMLVAYQMFASRVSQPYAEIGGAVATVPAGKPLGGALGGHHERAAGAVHPRGSPHAPGARPPRGRKDQLPLRRHSSVPVPGFQFHDRARQDRGPHGTFRQRQEHSGEAPPGVLLAGKRADQDRRP